LPASAQNLPAVMALVELYLGGESLPVTGAMLAPLAIGSDIVEPNLPPNHELRRVRAVYRC
jgi:hypothetical protein